MIKVTVDTNIIIKATKPNEADHDLAIRLLELSKENRIAIQAVAANASERGRSMSGENRSLQGDLASLGFSYAEVKILPIDWKLGMTYLDYFYLPNEEAVSLLQSVWDVIYSPLPMDHKKFCEYYKIYLGSDDDGYIDPRWRNYMCDVMTVVEYVRDCQDVTNREQVCILVTADDDDILKNIKGLQKLGAKEVLNLKDALNKIETLIAD